MRTRTLAIAACLCTASLLSASAWSAEDDAASEDTTAWRYEVTITNATRSQGYGKALVVSHGPDVRVFEVGQPASAELARLAEDGDNGPLGAKLQATPGVKDVALATMPIPPGQSAKFVVRTTRAAPYISVYGMLGTTNDSFGSVQGILANTASSMHYGIAYDAGSEANNEDCDYIPGPPCGHPGVRMPEGAEGYVRVSEGIHGIGDLPASQFDWRNPVIQVSLRRLP